MIDPRREAVLIRDKTTGQFEDKTSKIKRYEVQPAGGRILVVHEHGKSYAYGHDRVRVMRASGRVLVTDGMRVDVGGEHWRAVTEIATFVTAEYAVSHVFYRTASGEERWSTRPSSEIRVHTSVSREPAAADVLSYWAAVVSRLATDDPAVKPFGRLTDYVHRESALGRYLTGAPVKVRERQAAPIFPARCNVSQRQAVENALTRSVSVIEGPPGTGKTETILNLIANIVAIEERTVGVVSHANAAVDNVYDKFHALGFGHMIAKLGRKERREAFFATQAVRNAEVDRLVANASPPPDPGQFAMLDQRLRRWQDAERTRAQRRQEIEAYRLELRHFDGHLERDELPELERLPLLRRSSGRILEYLAETEIERAGARPGLLRRIQKYFRYGTMRGLDPEDTGVVLRLQATYYEKRITELDEELAQIDKVLSRASFDQLVSDHQQVSADILKSSLGVRYGAHPRRMYEVDKYRRSEIFDSFIRDYPVVLSTCHSLLASVPDGYLFDYLIIDEASQVDLITAALALSCCRNLVVVGDQRQLSPILKEVAGLTAPNPAYGARHNLLMSLAELYGESLPRTLLREHYRCDPAIIGFCNKSFYEGQLIPYKATGGERPMIVWRTPEGNHMRQHRGGGRSNQREIDVIVREVIPAHCSDVAETQVGVTTPYRRQADKVTAAFIAGIDKLDGIEADTVHKYQGRQRAVMILTTVLDETWRGRTGLSFVDDPQMINVAVSRAVDRFILVTNNSMMPTSRHIRDLVYYIGYHNPGQEVEDSAVVSIFDLLYTEYSARLDGLAGRLKNEMRYKSEDIAWTVLYEILAEEKYAHLTVKSQVLLRNLLPDQSRLTQPQARYVGNRASVDFVVYNRTTNRPLVAFEVDGFAFHENKPDQQVRDALKNSIFEVYRMPLRRLPTTGSEEEQKIRQALDEAEAHWAQLSTE